ncbi:MAG: glycosyltransferase [endosymbiont of Galathealinum brachiosum]|uniref:Glycosyltransferase n=1 Tax=endosymbiont of Galathealinum brachiosum TaxID=2200906 RepID=A0A370D7W0_9GAMM|nr:MAG: glycosyltransferase [endosymbiont of Galathealinum brachiosum]
MGINVDILGYQTSASGVKGDVETTWDLIKSGSKGSYIACTNPHSLVVAKTDSYFSESLQNANILLPDGIGIVLAAKILGINLTERVAGSDLFLGLSHKANSSDGLKYFFLGSTEEVLSKITDRMAKEFPNIEVCGTLSPPFKQEFSDSDNLAMIEQINKAKPDVLWVGMTAPKQEKWIFQNKDKLEVPIMGAIGAVFDFYAGTVKRSPEWACKMGLEWLPRLVREPRRLFRRNFISSPLFLLMILKSKFGLMKG